MKWTKKSQKTRKLTNGKKNPWLLVTDSGDRKMVCTICNLLEEKISWCTNMTFINGSVNFKCSPLSDHFATDGHKRAVKEKNHEDSISTDTSRHPEKTYIDLLLFVNLLELTVINHNWRGWISPMGAHLPAVDMNNAIRFSIVSDPLKDVTVTVPSFLMVRPFGCVLQYMCGL